MMQISRLFVVLRATAASVLIVMLVACGGGERSGGKSGGDIEFGIWVEDPTGESRFKATHAVPFVEGQAFGWRLRAARSGEPVKWVERLRLPSAPPSWEGVAESPAVTISPDRRTATTLGQSLPGDSYIGNVWYVGSGDPTGDYEISVDLQDGRTGRFRFRLVTPADGRSSAAAGEIV